MAAHVHLSPHQVRNLALCPGAVSEDALIENERTDLRRSGSERAHKGFSLIEVLVVVALAMTIAGMLVVHLTPTLQQFRANSASSQVVDVFRQAREYAITYRRYVQITFPNYAANGGNNQIRITVRNSLTPNAGADVVLTTVTLSGSVTFQLEAAVPDTPDAFGKATAVNFGNIDGGPPAGIYFQADGTFVNSVGANLNGTVFLGQTNLVSTARAVTVLGPTGRIRSYHVNGAGTNWFETR